MIEEELVKDLHQHEDMTNFGTVLHKRVKVDIDIDSLM